MKAYRPCSEGPIGRRVFLRQPSGWWALAAMLLATLIACESPVAPATDSSDSGTDAGAPVASSTAVAGDLATDSSATTAESKSATDTIAIGGTLTGSYLYSDPDGDPEGTSTYRWLRFDSETATTGGTAVAGATGLSYTTVDLPGNSDSGKWLRFEVTPVDAGGAEGEPALSQAVKVHRRIVIDTWSDPFGANDTYLTLIDAAGAVLGQDDDGNPAQGTYNVGCSRIDVATGLPVGTYYVRVHKPTDTGNPNYGFRVADYDPGTDFPTIDPVDEDETIPMDDEVDAAGVPTLPQSIALGGDASRSIFPVESDVDWFQFEIQ